MQDQPESMKIKLGSTQSDQLSGFTGVVTAITRYINGCTRVMLTPKALDKDGKIVNSEWFDDVQLDPEQWAAAIAQSEKRKAGGPQKAPRRAPDAPR